MVQIVWKIFYHWQLTVEQLEETDRNQETLPCDQTFYAAYQTIWCAVVICLNKFELMLIYACQNVEGSKNMMELEWATYLMGLNSIDRVDGFCK